MLMDIVIEEKFNPIGERPKNKPTRPATPKLRAIDNTSCSTKSSLFFPIKRMLTKQ